MPPPPQMQHTAPHGPESTDWPGTSEVDEGAPCDPQELIRKLYPVTYSDPTGRTAMRALQQGIGWVEPDAEVFLTILSKKRGRIDIRLDYEMKSMHMELLTRVGSLSATQSGAGYRARVKKETPTAGTNANQNCSEGSNTETNQKEYQR